MKFATFSTDNGPNVTGHYSSDVHPDYFLKQEDGSFLPDPDGPISDAVAITDEQWSLSMAQKLRIDPDTGTAFEYVKTDEEALAAAKEEKKTEINEAFRTECTGSVECTGGSETYTMDAGEEHANRMYNGCVLQERLGANTIDVTDYYNEDQAGVSLADGFKIAVLQGAHFAQARKQKNSLRKQVASIKLEDFPGLAEAITAVDQIQWSAVSE